MMENTGYKQAIIAYKVSKPGGEPLDVDGNLTSISGKKQAIALLIGQINPNPTLYEVQSYFDRRGVISGNPTTAYDVRSCPVGYIRVSPTAIVLDNENTAKEFALASTSTWRMVSGPTNIVDLSYAEGSAGSYVITASKKTNNTGLSKYCDIAEYARGDGEFITSVNWRRSDYIEVTLLDTVLRTFAGADGAVIDIPAILYFNEQKVLIGSEPTSTNDITAIEAVRGYMGKPTIPTGAVYAVINCYADYLPNAFIQEVFTGEGYFTFRNEATLQTATLYIASVVTKPWVLEDSTWNMLGFWYNGGIWNY